MTLPTSRNRTYAPESPIRSQDLNDLQDCIIGGKHGDMVKMVSVAEIQINTAAWSRNSFYIECTATSGSTAWLTPSFHAGDRLKSITFTLYGNGAADISLQVDVTTLVGGSTLGTTTVLNTPASWTQSVLDLPDTLFTSGNLISVIFSPSATGIRVGPTYFTYDRP